jgi:signal transduction histidine kinase
MKERNTQSDVEENDATMEPRQASPAPSAEICHLQAELAAARREIARKDAELARLDDVKTGQLESSTAEFRALTAHITRLQEEEKLAIASELNEELGQRLTALKLGMHWAADQTGTDPDMLRSHIEELIELNREAIAAIQSMAARLRPSLLDNLGLDAALHWLVSSLGREDGPLISLTCHFDETSLDSRLATTLYRIVQETLANILKYAKATRISVALDEHEHALALKMEDDGLEFGPYHHQDPFYYSVLGMRERVVELGGSFAVHREGEKTTVLSIELPLPRGAEPQTL